MSFVAIGRDDTELREAVAGTKRQIAFYASTPAYRAVLELHGRGDLQPELTRMSKQNRWEEMGDVIDDELLHEVAIVGGPEEVGRGLVDRWGDAFDRTSLYVNYPIAPEIVAESARVAQGC